MAAISKKEWVLVAVGLAVLAGAALRPSIRGNDGVGHYVYLASLLRGPDLDFSDEYRAFDAIKQYPYRFSELPVDPVTGRPTNRYGIGAALLWSPFVLTTHAGLKMFRPELATGLSRPYEWAVGLATAFWGSLGLAMLYGRLRRGWGPLTSAATLAGLILATPLGFYLYAHGSMAHGIGVLAATGLMLAFERAWRRGRLREMATCGFWAALLVMIRFQDASWVLVAGAALAWRALARPHYRQKKPSWRGLPVFVFALVFLIVFLPQMAVWKVLYGSWLSGPAPYLNASAGRFSLWPRHLWGVLVSERGGVLAWHPLFAIGLAGLCLLARRGGEWRVLALAGLAGFALQLWLVASWSIWWAGASFGNRFFISALPFLAPGVARLIEGAGRDGRRRRLAACAVLVLMIVWNMGLLIQYATEMVPREEPVPWSRVVHQNVIDVPRMIWQRVSGN